MNWPLCSLIFGISLLVSLLILLLCKKLLDVLGNSQSSLIQFESHQRTLLTEILESFSNQQKLLMSQQTDLLNRLQTHNWTEYSQLAASVSQPLIPDGPITRIIPDEAFNVEAADDWGDFEPPARFEDALAAVKGLANNVPT